MALTDQYLVEAENGFIGMQSRSNPLELQPGYVQYSQNMRFDRGTAEVRKGSYRIVSVDNQVIDSGVYSDATTGSEKLILVCPTQIRVVLPGPPVTTSSVNYPSVNIGGTTYYRTVLQTDKVCCFQANNLFYILRGETSSPIQTVGSYNHVGTLATITLTNHGYVTGDEVTITGSHDINYRGSFIVQKIDNNNFSYTMAGTPSASSAVTAYAQKARPPLYWDGNATVSVVTQKVTTGSTANFPPADFGIYFQNRAIVKRSRDKIAASDYFDYDTWDLQFNQFTINLGSNDYIVGFQPWQEDKFLVFQRNSIYYAYIDPNGYTAGASPGGNSFIKSLTSEFGCSARRSIVNAGEYIFFLSDNGVYLLNPSLDLKLLGNTTPLSDPISDVMNRINANYVSKAVGKVYNNRYYLAVPLDSSTRNNAVLVYSLLNKAWESVDIYPAGMYADNFLVAIYGSARRLYSSNYEGGVYLLEEVDYDQFTTVASGLLLPFDLPATFSTAPDKYTIDGQILTRRYFYNSFQEKRFSAAELDLRMLGGDAVSVVARAINPDNSSQVYSFTSDSEEDYTKRFRVAKRGFGMDLEINTTAGRPTVSGLRLYSTTPGRTLISKR